ncbi:hypothetical protein pb186bvf_009510 [Paramecium bursaria]
MRGAYNMLYRLFEKKRYQGQAYLNVVLASNQNIALACIESLKIIYQQQKLLESLSNNVSEILQEETPTEQGYSTEITENILKSRVRPFQLQGEIVLYVNNINCDNDLMDFPGVRVIQTNADPETNSQMAIQFAEENNFEYFDQYNDLEILGGFGTVGFEIEEQLKQLSNKVENIYIPFAAGGVIAGVSFYMKNISKTNYKIIGVKCVDHDYESETISSSISQYLVDEIVMVSEEEVEKTQCLLASLNQISEFYGALAYAGYLKYKLKHSLILLTGKNIPISALHKLHDKYNYKL